MDISEVNPDGNVYQIKDATARTQITALSDRIKNDNILSDFETISLGTTPETAVTMQYDGFVFASWTSLQGGQGYDRGIVVNNNEAVRTIGTVVSTGMSITVNTPVKKGDVVYMTMSSHYSAKARFYKMRDYTGR